MSIHQPLPVMFVLASRITIVDGVCFVMPLCSMVDWLQKFNFEWESQRIKQEVYFVVIHGYSCERGFKHVSHYYELRQDLP